MEGEALDIDRLLHDPGGKPQVSIFYVAHLNDAERMFFISLLLNQIVSWMRTQTGTTSLRALVYMDEVFGYLPPIANPSSKKPLLTLLKQARAFGVGLVLATQNPVDLDYKGLSNTGTWFIGRLQTERDKMRVLDALEGVATGTDKQFDRKSIDRLITGLEKRIFLMHNVNEDMPVVFETRWAMSYLRGPLTRNQIKTLMDPFRVMKTKKSFVQPVSDQIVPGIIPESVKVTDKNQDKPLLPPDIPEYFMEIMGDKPDDAINMLYQPMALGVAKVRFVDSKMKIDVIKDVIIISAIKDDPLPFNWDNSMEIALNISDLKRKSSVSAQYFELPQAAANKKNYILWQKELMKWLSRTQKMKVLKSPSSKECSRPGENERDFRIRLQLIVRKGRDKYTEKLSQKYASKFAKLDERIKRAQMALGKQKDRGKQLDYETVFSIGTSLFESMFGRNKSKGVGKTSREIGRSMKEDREKKIKEENMKALLQERENLEAQFQYDVEMMKNKNDPLNEEFEKVFISPSKADVSIRLVALVWVPGWQDSHGRLTNELASIRIN
jgi:hypothetical protein